MLADIRACKLVICSKGKPRSVKSSYKWHVNANCECMLGDDRKQCLKAKKLSKFGATGRLLSVVISYKPREKSANCRSMTAVSYKLLC